MQTIRREIVKICLKNLLIFSPLIIGMVLTNYFIDPGKLYRGHGYEKGIAAILLQGQNVANFNDCDERLVQMYCIKANKEIRDTVILGSSRVLQVGAKNFAGKKFFNHGVAGATLEDYFAIWEMYEQENRPPKTVILGLDPWILNRNNEQERWKSVGTYYYSFMKRMQMGKRFDTFFLSYNLFTFQWKQKMSLFSPSYFKTAFWSFIQQLLDPKKTAKNQKDYFATRLEYLDTNIRLADGTIAMGKDFIRKNLDYDVRMYVKGDRVYSLENFFELDISDRQNFEKFVDYLLKKNIRVIFLLPPYHPFVYAYFKDSSKFRIVEDAETYFRGIAKQKNISIVGSYDPGNIGLTENDFYDGMHPTREAMTRIAKSVITE